MSTQDDQIQRLQDKWLEEKRFRIRLEEALVARDREIAELKASQGVAMTERNTLTFIDEMRQEIAEQAKRIEELTGYKQHSDAVFALAGELGQSKFSSQPPAAFIQDVIAEKDKRIEELEKESATFADEYRKIFDGAVRLICDCKCEKHRAPNMTFPEFQAAINGRCPVCDVQRIAGLEATLRLAYEWLDHTQDCNFEPGSPHQLCSCGVAEITKILAAALSSDPQPPAEAQPAGEPEQGEE